MTGWPDPPGGQQHVDAAARTQVEDDFTRPQVRHSQRIIAAQAGRYRIIGQLALLDDAAQARAGAGLTVPVQLSA